MMCFPCCKNSKLQGQEAEHKTNRGSLEPVEESSGGGFLSAQDRDLIKETGEILFDKMHIEDQGETFLIAFFKTYPHHQKFFKAFRHIPPNDLRGLPITHNHGRKVIEQIALLVNFIDQPQTFKDHVKGLQKRHGPRRVSAKQFKDMLTMFLDFTRQQLGPQLTSQHELAWRKFNGHFLSVAEEYNSGVPQGHGHDLGNGDIIKKSESDDEAFDDIGDPDIKFADDVTTENSRIKAGKAHANL